MSAPCVKCRGTGEVIARSRSIGGGAVNDDWVECPACWGTGITRPAAPRPELSEQQALEILEGFARRGDWPKLLATLKTRQLLPTTDAAHS